MRPPGMGSGPAAAAVPWARARLGEVVFGTLGVAAEGVATGTLPTLVKLTATGPQAPPQALAEISRLTWVSRRV